MLGEMKSDMTDYSDAGSFEEFVGDGLVLVDFWAEWCAPCKALRPHIASLAADRPDIKIVLVDADDFPELAEKLDVRAVPTLILLKDGVELKRRTGALSKAMLSEFCPA
jgi:thioredoxin 1